MPKGMAAVAGLVLAVSLVLPVAAQTQPPDDVTGQMQRGRGKEARQAARVANLFSEAASTYAEIVNLCLTDRAPAVRLALSSARGELTRLRPMLKEETAAALEKRLADMEAAEEIGNLTSTALAATESFKTIITAMDPQMRRTPLEVSLHTYAAFKLVVLASVGQPDWPAVIQAQKESRKVLDRAAPDGSRHQSARAAVGNLERNTRGHYSQRRGERQIRRTVADRLHGRAARFLRTVRPQYGAGTLSSDDKNRHRHALSSQAVPSFT